MTTLGGLVIDAIHDPLAADTAALLREASAFLRTAVGGDPDLLSLARTMARAAEDFAFLQDEQSLEALKLSARAYSMCAQLIDT